MYVIESSGKQTHSKRNCCYYCKKLQSKRPNKKWQRNASDFLPCGHGPPPEVVQGRPPNSNKEVVEVIARTYRSLVWREIGAAFERRVLTGAVINFEHIEPRQFLEDAGSVVLEYVRGAIERYGNVKVNTAFNGEFVASDKRTVMSINTKNCELYPTSNVRECNIEKLESHSEDCGKLNKCAILLPSEDKKWLEFRNHSIKERAPFIVYADLECVLKKMEDAASTTASSYAYQQHEVFNIGYYVRCSYDDTLSACRFCRDNDCVRCVCQFLNIAPFSDKPFAPGDERARDHCHLIGRYRGPAHKGCNINYKNSFYIPVVFHNLSGYDAHFVIKEIATKFQGHVHLLPLTKEKYISFTKHVKDTSDKDSRNCVKLRFIDSYKLLSSSLDKLASYLDKDKLKIVRSEFSNMSDEDFNLLTRKGVFPYEYVDCFEKLDESC
ncbi:hypothetical protein ALC62_04627 [Cyphomyrmex costatus]|uniref:DNA-directed DNA polymerase n=1 Tax=Cyphomyrmex costatus TaxID=456900 RepID=A0A151IK07_9HYME|nr:hypothetical protein ALC62_04627 [Cyphomyrmex costatus]